MSEDRKARLRELESRISQLARGVAVEPKKPLPRKRITCPDCGKCHLVERNPYSRKRRCPKCQRIRASQKNTEYCREYRFNRRLQKAKQELGATIIKGGRLKYACQHCGEPMEATRISRKYCSNACRQAAHRNR